MRPLRLSCCLIVAAAAWACDSVELTITVRPSAHGSLEVSNADDAEWSDARLVVEVVETDNSTTTCFEQNVGSWPPGRSVTVPRCGDKIRLTLTTSDGTGSFSYASGQLYRRFGRKEVPIGSS